MTRSGWRAGVAMILSASVVAACAAPVVPSAPPDATAAPRGDIVTDAVSGLTFDRPSTWVRWLPNDHAPINDGPIAYLSTEPLLPACAVPIGGEPHPPDDDGRACDWPLASLSDDGVLVTLVNGRLLRPIPDAGAPLVVNARPTRLQADRPGTCAHVGGDETVVVPIPTITQPGGHQPRARRLPARPRPRTSRGRPPRPAGHAARALERCRGAAHERGSWDPRARRPGTSDRP